MKPKKELLAGFTLMETVVVVGVVATLTIIIVNVFLNSVKLTSKTKLNEMAAQNGSWAMEQIRQNLVNAYGVGMSCPDYEIVFRGRDNRVKTINCSGGKISLVDSGGQTVDLTQPEVEIDGCNQFISCDRPGGPGSLNVSSVAVNFVVKVGESSPTDVTNYVERNFSSIITIRN